MVAKNFVARFVKDESGATAIEYGLIAVLIAIAIIGAARALGDADRDNLQHVVTEMQNTGGGGSGSTLHASRRPPPALAASLRCRRLCSFPPAGF